MNASQSMTVARRLSLGFGLIILVLIAMVTVTLVGLSTINQQIYEITQINALNQQGVENLNETLRHCDQLAQQAGRLKQLVGSFRI